MTPSDFAHPGPPAVLRGDIPLDPRGEDADSLEQPDEVLDVEEDITDDPAPEDRASE